MQAILDRLEAHFPLGYRLLPDTDAERFLRELDRELERNREERVTAGLRALLYLLICESRNCEGFQDCRQLCMLNPTHAAQASV
jgi:hypothetical protein